MKPKISVIVPVYNVRDYVEACLRSILCQTCRELEILVTDDGSYDGSGEICERLAAEDPRIHVIRQTNGGLSAARNAAIRRAGGEYLAPVDSDDLLEPTYLEKLLTACEANRAQLAICDYRRIPESCRTLPWEEVQEPGGPAGQEEPGDPAESTELPEAVVLSPQECLQRVYHPSSSGMSFTAWGKLYRRELFTEQGMEYPSGKLHEDQFTTYRLIACAERIVYVPGERYGYRVREGSIMQKPFGRKRLDLMEATRGQCDFFLAKGWGDIAALAVNNHLRTEISLLACVRDRKALLRRMGEDEEADGAAGRAAQSGNAAALRAEDRGRRSREAGHEERRELQAMEEELQRALRQDAAEYLPRVRLHPVRKAVLRTAACCPCGRMINKLRMF